MPRDRSRNGSGVCTDRQPASFGRFDLFYLDLRLGLCSRVHLNAADLPRRGLVERYARERHGCLPAYFWMCWVCEHFCCAGGSEQGKHTVASFQNLTLCANTSGQIGYWFYVFFVFWDLFEFVFIYFFYVETKARTLEDLDAIFEARNPRKASTEKSATTTADLAI
jgi:hypothetical protein